MNRNQYVLPNDDTWMVIDHAGIENAHLFSSMMDAVHHARTMAAKYRSHVIVYDNFSKSSSAAVYEEDFS